ncbi:MAG: MerR family transcriptional regulator [Alicyclobacillus sp.]|nr:MerR family transcriptional regulator [Alicyclobacillus sp.]
MVSEFNRPLTVEAVVKRLGITPRTLRYYEEFGLITPSARTSGGHRLYDEETVERVEHILRMKETLGFSLQEIQQILDAEQSLERLREQYHASGRNRDHQRLVVEQYIAVLEHLIRQIDRKMEGLLAMRQRYQTQLDRSRQSLSAPLRGDEHQ